MDQYCWIPYIFVIFQGGGGGGPDPMPPLDSPMTDTQSRFGIKLYPHPYSIRAISESYDKTVLMHMLI